MSGLDRMLLADHCEISSCGLTPELSRPAAAKLGLAEAGKRVRLERIVRREHACPGGEPQLQAVPDQNPELESAQPLSSGPRRKGCSSRWKPILPRRTTRARRLTQVRAWNGQGSGLCAFANPRMLLQRLTPELSRAAKRLRLE
jgi:hypothetical protein